MFSFVFAASVFTIQKTTLQHCSVHDLSLLERVLDLTQSERDTDGLPDYTVCICGSALTKSRTTSLWLDSLGRNSIQY